MERHLLAYTLDLMRRHAATPALIPIAPDRPALADGAAKRSGAPAQPENAESGPEVLYATVIAVGDRLIDALRAEAVAWLSLFKEHQRGSLDEMRRARAATDALSAKYAAAIQQLTEQTRA